MYGEKHRKSSFLESMNIILYMKAVVFVEESGIPKIKIDDLPIPEPNPDEVLIKIVYCGVNQIDYQLFNRGNFHRKSFIPGNEASGYISEVGKNITGFERGDHVTVYPRIFCGECDMCLTGNENICREGGIIGYDIEGCHEEYMVAPVKNVFKIPRNISLETAATLPFGALSAYHALSRLKINIWDPVIILCASNDIGIYLLQLTKLIGGFTIGVSEDRWLEDFGADRVISNDELGKYVVENNILVKYVFDPCIKNRLELGLNILDSKGVYVLFNNILSEQLHMNKNMRYEKEFTLINSLGGTRYEFLNVIRLAEKNLIRPKIWRIYSIDLFQQAINNFLNSGRRGKILVKP